MSAHIENGKDGGSLAPMAFCFLLFFVLVIPLTAGTSGPEGPNGPIWNWSKFTTALLDVLTWQIAGWLYLTFPHLLRRAAPWLNARAPIIARGIGTLLIILSVFAVFLIGRSVLHMFDIGQDILPAGMEDPGIFVIAVPLGIFRLIAAGLAIVCYVPATLVALASAVGKSLLYFGVKAEEVIGRHV